MLLEQTLITTLFLLLLSHSHGRRPGQLHRVLHRPRDHHLRRVLQDLGHLLACCQDASAVLPSLVVVAASAGGRTSPAEQTLTKSFL